MKNKRKNKKILLIVEGEKDEDRLLRKFSNIFDNSSSYTIYAYKTSIYEMYDTVQELKQDSNLDLLLLLREKTNSKKERQNLSLTYHSIYLFFDFEPQHHKHNDKNIKELNDFFSDSRESGKLYISYPMIEATRHLKVLPDEAFIDRTIHIGEIHKYKQIVGGESDYTDLKQYNYLLIMNLIDSHMLKMLYIIKKTTTKLDYETYSEKFNNFLKHFLNIQIDQKNHNQTLHVLSTALFYLVDLKPKTYFRKIKQLRF
ncbi:MAG: hypothetical protein K9L26_02095 [Candidatus Izimaplasma sp.]|nr:hypothetical protein [Candidatus Izimaplasma bacterium]